MGLYLSKGIRNQTSKRIRKFFPTIVERVAEEALKKVPNVIAEDTTFLFEEFGESSINFKIRIWVDSNQFSDYLRFINDVIIALKNAFDQNDISIPFPIRTLDFNIKGGEKLSDMNLQVNQTDLH